MYNKYSKISYTAAAIFESVLIYTAVLSAYNKQWDTFKLSITAIITILVPFLLNYAANKKKLLLPPGFQLISSSFIFSALYIGEINKFYSKFWWFDLTLHIWFGLYAVLVYIFLSHLSVSKNNKTTNKRFALLSSLSSFSFSIAMGTLWELFEFSGDYLFNTGMIKGGLEDTATDLLVLVAAAFLTSVYYYYKFKNNPSL